MKQFLLTFAAVILAAIFLTLLPLVIISAIAASSMSEPEVMAKPHTIMTLDLSEAITDRDMDSPIYRVRNAMSGAEGTHGLNTLAKKLEAAAADDNVVALYLKGTSANVDAANMRPLRALISKFKEESGKPVYFYDEVIGSDKLLYLASAGDSIFISPEGSVAMYGAIVSKLYFKRIADKFGVGFDVLKHGRYKSAVEPFFRTSMSDDDKAQSQRIVDVIWAEVRDSIAASRHVAPERIDEFVDNLQSLTTRAEDLKQVGLIDNGLYYDQFEGKLAALADCEVKELNFMNIYDLTPADDNNHGNKQIAVVYAEGQIFDGSSESDDENIYADDLAKTLRKLRMDDDVESVVLRVNSPGGSALASDIIWREVNLLYQQKSVVVSMGGYAASGGYYISCAANYIYAEPTTLTGSIGVYGMVPNVEKAADNLGVDLDVVGSSKAPIVTGVRALTDGEKAVLMNSIERTYKTFVTRVSDGRRMSYEAVDSIGQGRVWMGADAVKNGLVNEVGSLDDAIKCAAKLAGLVDYDVVEYPQIDDSPLAILKSMGLSVRASVGHYLLGSDFDKFDRVRTQLQSSPTSVWAICDTEVR